MKSLFTIMAVSCCLLSASGQTKLSSGILNGLEARHIGPAVMGGRITAIDAVNSNPRVIYVGTAGGGIWKTTTGGTIFKPIFDKYAQSIGAMVIDQNNPNTIWAGTGESNMRNSVSIGDGLYKSTDGGDNWTKVGLDSSEHISKIAINPKDGNTVYVAVPGHLWNDNTERGLFKTTDGGKTWAKILYIDAKTGCADVVIDPANPNIIYATTWQFRRSPYSFSSGGPGSGFYKSIDAGKTWKKIQNKFADGELGRICVAVAPSEPNNVYAIAESKNTGLFISRDGGDTWKQQSSTPNVTARPFYFSVITVDPLDPKRIYRPAFTLSISDDAGVSFKEASFQGGWVHSDHHALWINPANTNHLLLGTDGGVYMSLDKGNNWLFLNNIPVSQFYHVSYDMQQPYNVYGGLQDNGSWMAPSQSVGGIDNGDWTNVGGGDGFWVQPDRSDKDVVYWEYQGGHMYKMNKKTNEAKDIQPYPLAGEAKLRFNWNTPIVTSETNPKTIYTGAQYLYRSRNQGDTWEKLSPDLTTNNPKKQTQEESGGLTVDNSSAENHCTIFSISESPLDENLIWVGTDDGNLQVTADGGKTWNNTVKNITGLPACTWVSSIEASRFNKNTVYVTFEGHTTGDMKTYVYQSTDLGKTWKNLSTADLKGFSHKVKEDLINPDLLFLGTELGLFVSINHGTDWAAMTGKIAPTPVRDIAIHPQTNDLILATHGRGILILDDISPLRGLKAGVLDEEVSILPSRPTYVTLPKYGAAFPANAGDYVGGNPTEEYMITYYLKNRVTVGDLKLEVFDQDGKFVGSVPGTKRKGINRVTWGMKMTPPKVATGVSLGYGGFSSPLVKEGDYTVKIKKGDKIYEGKLKLVIDPNSVHSLADRELQRSTSMRLYAMQEELAFLVKQVTSLQDSLSVKEKQSSNEKAKKSIKAYNEKLEKFRATLVAVKESKGITGEEKLREKMGEVYSNIVNYEGRPTDSQLDRVKGLEFDLDKAKKEAKQLFEIDLLSLNKMFSGDKPVSLLQRNTFDSMEN